MIASLTREGGYLVAIRPRRKKGFNRNHFKDFYIESSFSESLEEFFMRAHFQCQETILPSWAKLFPAMAALPSEVDSLDLRVSFSIQ